MRKHAFWTTRLQCLEMCCNNNIIITMLAYVVSLELKCFSYLYL